MKNLLPLLSFLFLSFTSLAQSGILSGKIIDDSDIVLPGAHISIEHPWGEQVKSGISAGDGTFEIKDVPVGGYNLVISFLGMENYSKEISVTGGNLDVGNIQLQEATEKLNEVVVKERIVRATQEGDTTSYNAAAYKTMADASAQELIEKMPGVVVDNGEVQAQGEKVQQVLVDGRPFFGNDPNAALKNLPAEVISKIEVFDERSDQSKFTGVDDGETTKTMNIVTKTNMRTGQFGKFQAGYGYEDKYRAGGNFSIFNGDQRVSLIGQSNNINIQNFSTEDLLGVVGTGGNRRRGGGRGGRGGRGGGGGSVNDFLVQQQGGIATTHGIGLNYSDKWGEKLEATGSYFFNNSVNTSVENLNRQFIDAEELSEVYNEGSETSTDNFNHRANLKLEYKINEKNSIIMRTRGSWQMNQGLDSLFGQTFLEEVTLNQTENKSETDLAGIDFNNNILFRHRFAKIGRTISLNVGMGLNEQNGESFLTTDEAFFDATPFLDTLDQFSNLDVKGWNLSTNISYTEPLAKGHNLMFEYRTRYTNEESDVRTFDYSNNTEDYSNQNNELSNVFSSNYLTHTPGIGYNYRKGKFMFMTRARVEIAELNGEETFPNVGEPISKNFVNFVPFAMIRYNPSRQENVRLFYRSNATAPQVSQLQTVINNANPLQLSTGNSDLNQSVSHRLFGRYQKTNTEKSTVFFLLVGGSVQQNYIGNSLYLNETSNPLFDNLTLDPGAQITQPVNMDGYWDARTYITYGIPLSKIKSNLNFDVGWDYSNTPSLINDLSNISKNTSYRGGLVLSSNISEKVDFTLSTRTSYSTVANTVNTASNNNNITQSSRLKFNIIFGKDLIYRTNLTHQLFAGLSDEFNQNYWLWNMSIGKKIFKNKLGEISISAFDILKQNNSIQRNITEVYIEDVRTQPLTRFFMLNFIYNFRNFRVGKAPAPQQRDRSRDWGGRGF